MTTGSTRRPWPWHIAIEDVGYVCVEDEQTGVVIHSEEIPRYENVVPAEQDYSSLPAYAERTSLQARLTAGMGQSVQTLFHGKAYHYAIDADLSIGGRARKGSEVLSTTPTTTGGEVRGFPEFLNGWSVALFQLAGRYVLRRTGDTSADWPVSLDLGAGTQATKAVRYKNGPANTDAGYVAVDDGTLHQYDGAAWHTAVLPAGQTAVFVETIREELWIAGGNRIAKVSSETADPLLAASWAASIVVGDASSAITWLDKIGDLLLVFKDDLWVWTVDATGEAVPLYRVPGTRDSSFGRNAAPFLDWLWFRAGDSLYRIGPAGSSPLTVDPVGPERLLNNTSDVRGRPVATAGHSSWFNYVAVYNPANGNSYLLKWGEWLNPDGGTEDFTFAPVYHGAVKVWSGKRVTAMAVSGVPDANNDRLYVGFSDGSHDRIVLPKNTPDPLQDANCRFTTGQSFVYYPDQHHNAQADDKGWRSLTVFGPRLSATDKARFAYGLYPGAAHTDLTTDFTVTGQRVDFPDGTASKVLAPRLELISADNTSTPDVEGIAVHANVHPALVLQHEMTVIAQDNAALRDGSADWKTAEDVKDAIKGHRRALGTVTLLHPDEGSLEVTVTKYAERVLNLKRRPGIAWALPIQMVEFRTNETYGTIGRMRGYLVGDLTPFTVGGLSVL